MQRGKRVKLQKKERRKKRLTRFDLDILWIYRRTENVRNARIERLRTHAGKMGRE